MALEESGRQLTRAVDFRCYRMESLIAGNHPRHEPRSGHGRAVLGKDDAALVPMTTD